MAIINCPECGKKVSDTAQACPHCGKPMSAVVIEQTGKQWKKTAILGWIVLLVGFLIMLYSYMSGIENFYDWVPGLIVVFIGVIILATSDIGAWWNHK